jgi:hypothetical protein
MKISMTITTKRTRTRTTAIRTSSALAVLALLCSHALEAQKKPKNEDANARNVQGVVMDQQDNPVPHAVVQLEDTRTLQVRSFITLDDGTYHFSGLRGDVDYRLKAIFKDTVSAVKTFSVFDSRKTGVYNLKLEKQKASDKDKP